VRAAFSSGELSYSKVRAITRVATPELEVGLVELARYATASQLEQIVREYRRADPDEGRTAQALRERRYVRSYTDDDGMVVINARLSPEDGAVVLAAIEAARAALTQTRSHGQAEEPEVITRLPAETLAALTNVPAETPAGPVTDVSAETPAGPVSDVSPETLSAVAGVSAETPGSDDPWSESAVRAELALEAPLRPVETAAADALVAVCASVLGRGLTEEGEDPHVSVLMHVDEHVLGDASAQGCATSTASVPSRVMSLGASPVTGRSRASSSALTARSNSRARRERSLRPCAVAFSHATGAVAGPAAPPAGSCTPITSCSGQTAARRRCRTS
jgi:hypothetical protein